MDTPDDLFSRSRAFSPASAPVLSENEEVPIPSPQVAALKIVPAKRVSDSSFVQLVHYETHYDSDTFAPLLVHIDKDQTGLYHQRAKETTCREVQGRRIDTGGSV
jgi:hypothetical protein